jgi:site-specific DNA-methyltransferase (adenine-specific)
MRVETIGDATLYLGDCRELLADPPKVDAIITDPPYGQALKVNTFFAGGTRVRAVVQRGGSTSTVKPNIYPDVHGDDQPFDPAPWLKVAPTVVFWGAHKFADRLPPGGWFVWDKVPTGKLRDQGDGEAAWINRDQPMRIFRLLWDGLCVGEGARHEVTAGQQRYHPTQKPEILMRWCLEQAGRPERFWDPYMGAGSGGVAAAQMGLGFVGCEIEPRYFDIACSRIEQAQKQRPLFQAPASQPVQLGLESA